MDEKPRTLKLFRKEYSALAITLAVVAVVLAVAFAVYLIYSATLPPDLSY
jgi:hypothetical protein